jgi:wyosine [tRNA(Phe)-imidazoG37] synthetase (radical SAM superfamily)
MDVSGLELWGTYCIYSESIWICTNGCVYMLCWIGINKNKLEEREKNKNIREYMIQGWKYHEIVGRKG